jgi:peptidoglycan/xylan/chitin deacetylase (PgdA/CDA1 family)
MRVPILMYHWFDGPGAAPTRGPQFQIPPEAFRRQMEWLARGGGNAVSLSQIVDALEGRAHLPPRPVAITFDDGYEDFYRHALGVLTELQLPATLFVVSGLVGRTNLWDQPTEPARPLMDWPKLREVAAAGVEIGAHSVSHPDMRTLAGADLAAQCGDSRRSIEDRLGRPVRYFAYPFGFHHAAARHAVRDAGYHAACAVLLKPWDMLRSSRFALMRAIVHADKSFANFRLRVRLAAPRHRES